MGNTVELERNQNKQWDAWQHTTHYTKVTPSLSPLSLPILPHCFITAYKMTSRLRVLAGLQKPGPFLLTLNGLVMVSKM